MHQSFISYKNFRSLKGSVVLCVAVLGLYVMAKPLATSAGGTWLGYLGGSLGGLLIVWLAALGIRKRKYKNTELQAVGWVSTHIYLGTALLLVVSLHSGFHLGLNIHSLAYVLTIMVILTGFYGLYAYAVYPNKITLNRDGMSRDSMYAEITEIDEKCLALSEKISPEMFAKISENVEETKIKTSLLTRLFSNRSLQEGAIRTAIDFVQEQHSGSELIKELDSLLQEKDSLVGKIERDIRYHFRLGWWLYLHVPLTVGVLLSLLIHVYVVLFHW